MHFKTFVNLAFYVLIVLAANGMHLNVHAFNLFISILNLKGYMKSSYDVKVSIGTRINGIACIIDLPRARDLHFCPDARSGFVHWLQATSCQILSPVCDG